MHDMDRASRTDRLCALGEPLVGDTVVAEDGALGRVEHIIRSETRAPVYLVVSAGRLLRRRYPIVPWSLVTTVDPFGRRVHIHGRRRRLGHLPETVPIVL